MTEPDGGVSRGDAARLDPTGKHALFETPVQAPPDHLHGGVRDGRHALYSAAARRPGTVIVDCSECGARSRESLLELGLGFLPFTAWLPGRRHGHLMRCPSCGGRHWCRIGWTE